MPVQVNELTIAHSPDSDDAFMFYALANDKLDTGGLKINQVLKDIQSLNQDAINQKYEVSAISFAAYPSVRDKYLLMPCGASIGDKYGPMIVARKDLTIPELKSARIAVPGKLTTAYLTMQMWQPGLEIEVMPFDHIIEAVLSGRVDAGLIIHEGQLTYAQSGLKKIIDLGEWWFAETGLPLPLGGNVIRKDLGMPLIKQVTELFRNAIKYSLEHRPEALEYAMTFARDMQKELADKFVGMYVNDLTVDYGDRGRAAVDELFKRAYEKGVLKELIVPEFVDV